MDAQLIQQIQNAYMQLDIMRFGLCQALLPFGCNVKSRWVSKHCYINDQGKWYREVYPILCVHLPKVCNVYFSFDYAFLCARMKRDDALKYSFEVFGDTPFHAYGVADPHNIFYRPGQNFAELKEKLRAGTETDIEVCLRLPADIDSWQLLEKTTPFASPEFYCDAEQ